MRCRGLRFRPSDAHWSRLRQCDDYRPKPVADWDVTEVSIADGMISGRESYDFWAFRNSGDYYLLKACSKTRALTRYLLIQNCSRLQSPLMFLRQHLREPGVAQRPL